MANTFNIQDTPATLPAAQIQGITPFGIVLLTGAVDPNTVMTVNAAGDAPEYITGATETVAPPATVEVTKGVVTLISE